MFENSDSIFRILNLVIGIWATYSAITGKGAAYKNDYPKGVKEAANALLRKFLWGIGPFMVVSTGLLYLLDYLGVDKQTVLVIDLASVAIVVVAVVVYVILFRKRYGKYLK